MGRPAKVGQGLWGLGHATGEEQLLMKIIHLAAIDLINKGPDLHKVSAAVFLRGAYFRLMAEQLDITSDTTNRIAALSYLHPGLCEWRYCQQQVKQPKVGRRRVFCGDRCRQKSHRAKLAKHLPDATKRLQAP